MQIFLSLLESITSNIFSDIECNLSPAEIKAINKSNSITGIYYSPYQLVFYQLYVLLLQISNYI